MERVVKVLIVDDDRSIQRILQRILSHLHCQVAFASNGVEALASIETSRPDLVLLDVDMPVMDGVATLATIRASPSHAALPVVSVSAVADRALVIELVNLGISDYLLKPISPEGAHRRLSRVIASLPAQRRGGPGHALSASGESGERKPRLLLVDPDPNFRTFVEQLLGGRFDVVATASGGEALQVVARTTVDAICLGRDLALLSASQLAAAIRGPAEKMAGQRVSIYLVHESGEGAPADADVFDGGIRRTFVPEAFLQSFDAVVTTGRLPDQRLAALVRDGLGAELLSAAEQAIGVMTGQEIAPLSGEDATVADEVGATVELQLARSRRLLAVTLRGSRADIEALAERIVGSPTTVEEGAGDAIAELLNTIGGRLRASLALRGLATELGQPRSVIPGEPPAEPEAVQSLTVRTQAGATLQLTMAVLQSATL